MAFVDLTLSHSLSTTFPKLQSFAHLHVALYHLYCYLLNISKSIHSLKLKFVFKVSVLLFWLNIV